MRIAGARALAIATIGFAAIGLAAIGLGASAPASAQQVSPEQALAFLDFNRDGRVDLNEYLNFQLPKLAQNDANGNGKLSQAEFTNTLAPAAQKNAKRSFDGFDRNNNNALEQQEFLGYHAFVFRTYIDTNKDGFMSAAEWAAIIAATN